MCKTKQEYDPDLIFMTIPNATRKLGMAQSTLRTMAKNGEIPAIAEGKRYFINIPETKEILAQKSRKKLNDF